MNESDVNECLKTVIDPELGVNIIDLGLVYDLKIDAEQKSILVTMTLSTPHCPMGNAIQWGVTNALTLHFPDYISEINLVWDPVWTIERISEEGRGELDM